MAVPCERSIAQDEGEYMIKVDEAIRIAKIIAQAPEERLPMIVKVFEQADVSLDGLDAVADWRALVTQGFIVDLQTFIEKVRKHFPSYIDGDLLRIPAKEFSAFCREERLNAYHVRSALAGKGMLVTTMDGDKTCYTTPSRITVDGEQRTVRCVVLKLPE
jgi:hypothetical protein